MTDAALSVDFVVLAGKDENRWIRLEQVGQEEQAITFAEAAELIDELYGTSPCNGDESSEGTGGEAASEPALDEESFLNLAATRLRILSCFPNTGFWPVEVDVLRSHREGDWRLSSDVAEIGGSVVVTGTKTEVVELENAASYDLNYPYGGDLRVSGAVAVDVRGSTVNFARPVTGRVRLTYTAVWDRVSVKVPAKADKNGIYRADPAAVICFWERLAAPLTLEQPEDDATLAAIVHVCPRYRFKHEGDCYERVEHYSLCNCSGREDGEMTWEEMVEAPCPDGTAAGSVVARRRELDGYVECPDEEDRFHDPEFFRETCCGEPESLPRCEVEREAHQGGAEIEGGPDSYRETYGEGVRLTAIMPEGGCGEIVRTWRVVEDPSQAPPPKLPELLYVTPGQPFAVTVTDGKAPKDGWGAATWNLPSGVELTGASGTTATFRAADSFREGSATVTDACGRESNALLLKTAQQWVWMYEEPNDCRGCKHYDYRCESLGCFPDYPYHKNLALLESIMEDEAPGQDYWRYRHKDFWRDKADPDSPYNNELHHLVFSANEEWMLWVEVSLNENPNNCNDFGGGELGICARCDVVAPSIPWVKIGWVHMSLHKVLVWG